jgi:ferredoxin
MLKVSIEREDCTSCSTCWETCPEVFEQNDDDSFSQIVEKYRKDGSISEGVVPDDLKACVEDAAASCPVSIITVEEG